MTRNLRGSLLDLCRVPHRKLLASAKSPFNMGRRRDITATCARRICSRPCFSRHPVRYRTEFRDCVIGASSGSGRRAFPENSLQLVRPIIARAGEHQGTRLLP
jgi:hypothetical protein